MSLGRQRFLNLTGFFYSMAHRPLPHRAPNRHTHCQAKLICRVMREWWGFTCGFLGQNRHAWWNLKAHLGGAWLRVPQWPWEIPSCWVRLQVVLPIVADQRAFAIYEYQRGDRGDTILVHER